MIPFADICNYLQYIIPNAIQHVHTCARCQGLPGAEPKQQPQQMLTMPASKSVEAFSAQLVDMVLHNRNVTSDPVLFKACYIL